MNFAGNRLWLICGIVLALASLVALQFVTSQSVIPSAIRDPAEYFVAPGVAVWWLVLGGPFQTVPHSTGGVALAAGANAILWWLGLRSVVALMSRLNQRR